MTLVSNFVSARRQRDEKPFPASEEHVLHRYYKHLYAILLIMPIIPPQLFVDFWQWLDANAEELARMAGVSQQQEIKAALREIAKATGSDWDNMIQILGTVSGNRILQLFARNATCFSEIAKIALRHTNAAFYALNAAALSELLKKNPEGLKKLFSEVIGSVSKSALPAAVDSALFSLSNENIGSLSVEKPELLISTFSQITEASGKFSPHVFSAISDKNISALFGEDPRIILNTFSEVAATSNSEAAAIFLHALKKQKLFELFKKNPEKLVRAFTDPAKACGQNSAAVFYLLRNQRIAYMLEMNPESLIISMNAFVDTAGKGAEAAIPLIFDERVEDRFVNDAVALGESFNSLVTAAGEGASKAIASLGKGGMLDRFLENPEPVINVFSSIARVSGGYADAAFGFLANSRVAVMFENDTDGMVHRLSALAASCGDSAPVVFGFLGKEKVAELFEQNPDGMVEFFAAIGTAARGKKDALGMFANSKFIQGFEEWPEETMENLRDIANSAGPYAGDIFALFSKDRLAQTITELVSGKHLAKCLTDLVNGSGKDTPMVLRLFESDEFAKQFINDPYKEEQIVSHLRSFTGNDLALGLEVLNDPEIAPVFSDDPSVLVTTRFRAYVNEATAIPGISVFHSLVAILEDRKVKGLFIDYVRQEFHGGGDPHMLENDLLPALRAHMDRGRRLGF